MRNIKTLKRFAITLAFCGLPVLAARAQAASTTVTVTGLMDPYLAGMPANTTASQGPAPAPDYANGSSSVPAGQPTDSPLLVPLTISGGDSLTFTGFSGLVQHSGGPPWTSSAPGGDGPDGSNFTSHTNGVQDGFSNPNIPFDAMVGVFIDGTSPNTSMTPASVDFSVTGGTSFSSLSPGLQQIFFIGDGLTGTGSGAVQSFIAPAGATTLWLGTWDSYQWWNNVGQFSLTVNDTSSAVPLPAAAWPGFAALGLAAAALTARRVLA